MTGRSRRPPTASGSNGGRSSDATGRGPESDGAGEIFTSHQQDSVAGRPQVMRAMNERLMLEQVRASGPVSRADLARRSGLSKPTVALALSSLEDDGLVRVAGQRTGVRGPAAVLYEVRPEAGYVLGLDVGREFVRGALADLMGATRAKASHRAHDASAHDRVAELESLADDLTASAGITRSKVTQVVIGSPGVYDPGRGALTMARNLPGWERPDTIAELRRSFGPSTVVENDIDVAVLAERHHGHGRDVDTFVFVSVGTGIGMGMIIGGRLHRGAHGAAGEIAYLPIGDEVSAGEARRRGRFETAASASGVVRAARSRGMRGGGLTARRVFEAAANGDERAAAVVRAEGELVAQALSSVIAVVDPELVVLGGGVGRAPGFAGVIAEALEPIAPIVPEIRVSALGDDAVVEGCLAAGLELAWGTVLARG